MGRAPCCEKVGLKKGRWTEEEDEILTKYIQANGEGSWRSLPKNAGLLRCGKSCRLRWINYLRADLKRGNISVEEEGLIIKLHASFGNRWSLIASHMPGRTDNEIKNYWNSHLSRKVYTLRAPSSTAKDERRVLDTPPKRKGGRTSRWAMKKNKTYAQKPVVAAVAVAATHQSSGETSSVASVLESENVGTTVEEEDFMVLEEPEMEERKEEEGEEKGEESAALRCVDNGGALSFNGIMDTACMLEETSGADAVRNNINNGGASATCTTDKVVITEGEAHSCSSVASAFDDWDWDWESVMQLDDHNDESASTWGQTADSLLTWLWEDDDWEKDFLHSSGEIDPGKQNDMLAWFLS